MNDTLKNPTLWEFSGMIDKQSNKYGGHDLQKAVNHKMNSNSKSFRHRNHNTEMTMNSYAGDGNSVKKLRTLSTNPGPSPYGMQNQNSIAASTMIGKYSEPISRLKRKTVRPKTIIKNGKLLISKKTIA